MAFDALFYKKIIEEMKKLYLNDSRPWVIGYSGGKDSTCVSQMIYSMLKELSSSEKIKEVTLISVDTLVESPLIKTRIYNILKNIAASAKKDEVPLNVKILKPEILDTFWVNLIGKGYPSPNKWFRWCTDRLKIKPMSKYIKEVINASGEVIIILGARKNESASRAQTMGRYEIKNSKLRRNSSIPNSFIYAPIEDFDFTDVWEYLLENKSPWGDDNNELARLYKRVNKECPLVVDSNTPSCGGSRFGCWVCTVVERDKAMEGLIADGEEWLKPLLDFRDWLRKIRDDKDKREPLRKREEKRQFSLEYFGKEFIPEERKGHKVLGPFSMAVRYEIFKRLLDLQEIYKYKNVNLISEEEIEAIKKIWVYEGNNDKLTKDIFNLGLLSDDSLENELDVDYPEDICKKYNVPFNLLKSLLIAEKDFSEISKRTGIYNRLESVLEQYSIYELKNEIVKIENDN